jgi:hypothetical protein
VRAEVCATATPASKNRATSIAGTAAVSQKPAPAGAAVSRRAVAAAARPVASRPGIREPHYRSAYDAAANICSGIFDTIPVDLHDVVHEAVMAGYAAALSDLEEGKLDDQVRERSESIE